MRRSGYPRISVVEFGIAGGSGLLSLERVVEPVEHAVEIGIDIYGFDAGKGLPKPKRFSGCAVHVGRRDSRWMSPNCARLKRAQLRLGLVEQNVPEFVRTSFAPVAFISFDLDLYTGTKQTFRLLEAAAAKLLPRVFCYFDDIMGFGHNDFTE
jgi:hypothetical protein